MVQDHVRGRRLMKTMTIWQRLNTALLLLVVLLLAGVGLAVWVEKAGSDASERSGELSGARDRIYSDVIRIDDAVRGLLLDPKNEPEKSHQEEAEKDLKQKLKQVQDRYHNHAALMAAVTELRDFTLGKQGAFY